MSHLVSVGVGLVRSEKSIPPTEAKIATDGAFLPDGRWQPLGVADAKKLQTLFMHRVLTALKEKELIDDAVIEQIVSQTHSGFSAWWGDPIPPDVAAQRLFLSRYIDRGPVAESRISLTKVFT